MGAVIGAGIGAVGSIIGGQQSAKAAKQSAQIQAAAADRAGERALTGYRYLTDGEGSGPMKQYIGAGTTALGHQGETQNLMMDLLGITNYENRPGGKPQNALAPAPQQNAGGLDTRPHLYPPSNNGSYDAATGKPTLPVAQQTLYSPGGVPLPPPVYGSADAAYRQVPPGTPAPQPADQMNAFQFYGYPPPNNGNA